MDSPYINNQGKNISSKFKRYGIFTLVVLILSSTGLYIGELNRRKLARELEQKVNEQIRDVKDTGLYFKTIHSNYVPQWFGNDSLNIKSRYSAQNKKF